MSTVKPFHRAKPFCPIRSKEEYFLAVELFKDTILSQIADKIYSLILCGSLIKNTLTPGWSDIDIVIVVKNESDVINLSIYQGIAQGIAEVERLYGIPVGIDLITSNEIPGKNILHKILGRPINLTYQMLTYSHILYGEDILSNIPDPNTNLMILEQYLAILSCAHNYRRFCCQNAVDGIDRKYFLSIIHYGLKILFKIVETLSDFFDGKLVGYSNLLVNLEGFLPDSIHEKVVSLVILITKFSELNYLNENELKEIAENISETIDLLVHSSKEIFEDKIKYITECLSQSNDNKYSQKPH
ncbi:nucleotidyltransferase domain-containing protein [Nodularia sp. LEGE 04288]|uniref:nucleotidyltransferase domain-containing protein n=1 Tax=Nodularia sp. LEGE 04288 TaxID=1828639 RepID=UPI001D1267A7|nr:nucleotidyltransferase domain-containing protein [Nodularia sp. LEGE 04288]MCC2695327.1 nucleotidyltransferase domain-containing protein [Nodularia sp. LEGE 04288]